MPWCSTSAGLDEARDARGRHRVADVRLDAAEVAVRRRRAACQPASSKKCLSAPTSTTSPTVVAVPCVST